MKTRSINLLLLSILITQNIHAQDDAIGTGLTDSSLVVFLRSNYSPVTTIGYNAARDSMFQVIDIDETDSVTCVYTGLRAKKDGTRTPGNGSLSFNTEHSWPQSFYDEADPMKSDIHHLYPTWSSPNSSRGNNPFAEIADNLTTSWWYWENGGSISSIPNSNLDAYSEYYNNHFEPREDHKGNVARAMFYFWAMYENNSDIVNDDFDNQAFFDGMKNTLHQWHYDDPVDSAEIARSLAIEEIQGNRNPFVHDTSLVRRAYFEESSGVSSEDIFISEVYEANGGTVKYIELFNPSAYTVSLSSGQWRLLRFTNDGTTPSATITLTGSIDAYSFFVVGDDDPDSGVESIFGSDFVDQDESSINHNGNDSYALIKNATTTPDTVDYFAKDNIGNSSFFATDQVAYRIYSALPNDGSFGQTAVSNDGDTVASGNWVVFDINSDNSNAKLIATPGYSKGIESSLNAETVVTGNAQWRLISIPGNNVPLTEISDDTAIQGFGDGYDSNVFTYNSSGEYSMPASTNSVLEEGEGLAVYFFDNNLNGSSELPIVLDVSEDEPSADVSVNLNTTTSESGSYLTLVGNPFQSNFETNSITYNNSIQSNIHVLNNGLYSTEPMASTIILPWQGFWIESDTSNAATFITFPTSGKTFSSATVSAFSKTVEEQYSFNFNLNSSHTKDKGCTLTFNTNAKIGWDRWDASKLKPTLTEYAIMACLDGEKEKSVHSLPFDFDQNLEIPLSISSIGVEPEMELKWEFPENFPEYLEVTLFDNQTGSLFDLRTTNSHQFSESEEKSARFTLNISPTTVNSENEMITPSFSLHQNYPNPFNPSTVIGFELPQSSRVTVKVFDSLGRTVKVLADGNFFSSGTHSLTFEASSLSSGLYFYGIETEFGSDFKKMTLIK